jgi:hypothetical protein
MTVHHPSDQEATTAAPVSRVVRSVERSPRLATTTRVALPEVGTIWTLVPAQPTETPSVSVYFGAGAGTARLSDTERVSELFQTLDQEITRLEAGQYASPPAALAGLLERALQQQVPTSAAEDGERIERLARQITNLP